MLLCVMEASMRLQRQAVESGTILCSRSMLGDERALDLGMSLLPYERRLELMERHSNQVLGMIESAQDAAVANAIER